MLFLSSLRGTPSYNSWFHWTSVEFRQAVSRLRPGARHLQPQSRCYPALWEWQMLGPMGDAVQKLALSPGQSSWNSTTGRGRPGAPEKLGRKGLRTLPLNNDPSLSLATVLKPAFQSLAPCPFPSLLNASRRHLPLLGGARKPARRRGQFNGPLLARLRVDGPPPAAASSEPRGYKKDSAHLHLERQPTDLIGQG